jgi:hypothetical protein
MTSQESPGLLRRIFTALGRALKRGILGRSTHDYMKQFTGSDEYWDRVIAAQLGWPQKQLPKPDPDRFRTSGRGMERFPPTYLSRGEKRVDSRPGPLRSSLEVKPQPIFGRLCHRQRPE